MRNSVHRPLFRRSPFGKRPRTAVIASVLLVVALSPFGPPASAGPDSGTTIRDPQSSDHIDPALRADMRRQDALQTAVEVITEEAIRNPSSGYAGLGFEGDGLTIHHKGRLTPGMDHAVREARRHGKITVKPARFSYTELDAAADRIGTSLMGRTDIQSIEIRPDGSGLRVETMPATRAAAARAHAIRRGWSFRPVDSRLNGQDFGVPVQVAPAATTVDLLGCATTCNRLDDTAAWNGGTRTLNPDAPAADPYYRCTTGFGVKRGTTTYVLTADHCATAPDRSYDNRLELIGSVYSGDWDKDLLLINARGFHRIFDGSPTTSNTKNVLGWGYHAQGEYLCHSGATTGTRCNLRTDGGDYRIYGCDSDGDCFYRSGLIKSTQIDGLPAAAGGDSGGPVFSLTGSGVRAKGIVIAGGGSTMYFQDWADVIRIWNAYPVTP